MKAVGLFEFGDPDVLQVVDVPTPAVPEGAVLVQVDATPVNPTDLTFRRGGRVAQLENRPRPLIPGVDFAGHVAAVGPEASGRLRVGDPVLGIASPLGNWSGSYARFVLVDERSVVRAPAGVPLADASTLLLNAITARMALDALDVSRGQTVLITGAAGKEMIVPAVKIGGKIASLKFWRAELSDVKVVPILAPEQATNTAFLEDFVSSVSRGELDLRVSNRMPYTEAAKAHRLLEAGGVRGRIVLDFSSAN